MTRRQCPSGTTSPVPIMTEAEYRKATKELKVLQRAPLGTPETEGLQELIEAILDYEEKHRCGNGHDTTR
jgi:hypothetical protein